MPTPPVTDILEGIGPRLKALRLAHEATLGEISYATGISISTLSRLESGKRRPNLELLIPIARALNAPLDQLVGTPIDDPRIPCIAHTVGNRTYIPLSREPGPRQTFKIIIPATETVPSLRVHEGTDWFYVISGRLRLVLATHEHLLGPGEAAEFSTLVPHWLGSTGEGPVEILSIFGREGARVHLHTSPSDDEPA